MIKLSKLYLIALLAGTLGVLGCSDDPPSTGNGGTAGTGGAGGTAGGGGTAGPCGTAGTGGGQVVRVFVTSEAFDGDLGGLAGADEICSDAAIAANLCTTWTAWLSDNNTDARDRIADGEYQLLNGTVVADDKTELTSGTLQAAINRDELGNTLTDTTLPDDRAVWTATLADGTYNNEFGSCNGWEDNTGGGGAGGAPQFGGSGDSIATDSNWTDQRGGRRCNFFDQVYCFEDIDP